jgi:hypothetical protein
MALSLPGKMTRFRYLVKFVKLVNQRLPDVTLKSEDAAEDISWLVKTRNEAQILASRGMIR